MRRASEPRAAATGLTLAAALALGGVAGAATAAESAACTGAATDRPVYLTFDTGHMAIAPLVAEVLNRHGVKATFFLANERTKTGGSSLDDAWAPWWMARSAEGHVFGSHTWDHDVWQADLGPAGGSPRFRMRPTQGPAAGKPRELDAAALCNELARPAERFKAITGQTLAPLWRAPGGKTSATLLAAAESCGWRHVPWTPAGFLGDELPTERGVARSRAAKHSRGRHPARPPRYLVSPGPLGSCRPRAADRRPA
jgi:peptidoglycan-N-acetylmuramic acid deacetylase